MQTVGVLIFPGFELLDAVGPLEMLGLLPEPFAIRLVAQRERDVASGQGPTSPASLAALVVGSCGRGEEALRPEY